jgi:hypothetical protein
MPSSLKRPTYEELIELSNGELMRRIKLAKDAVASAWREHRFAPDAEQIYETYENERLKRLSVAHFKRPTY